MRDFNHLQESTSTPRPSVVTAPSWAGLRIDQRQISHPNQPSAMFNHARHGSVQAVYDDIDSVNAVASQATNVNMAGQQHMPGHERMLGQQHMAFNVGGQNVPRTRQVSQNMGAVSSRAQSFAYPPIGYPMTIPQEFPFPQVPVPPLPMPSNMRRVTIDDPNQIYRPHRSVAFAAHPEVIDDLEEASDEEVFRYPNYFGPRHSQVILQQGQIVPTDIVTRPYSYMTYYRPGAGYPSMANDLKILVSVLNPKNNLKQSIDILARRSPYELDALRYQFNLMTGQDLQSAFSSLVTKENESIKSVIAGLTLGPMAFDLWLLDGVSFPILSVTDN